MNHQLSKLQLKWEEQMLMSPWHIPEICTSQGTVTLRRLSRHKLLCLWIPEQMSRALREMVRWPLPYVHFMRSEPGASVMYFPFGLLSIWFLLYSGWEERRDLGKNHISSTCTSTGFFWSFLQGSCSVYQQFMTLYPHPHGVSGCISRREGSC